MNLSVDFGQILIRIWDAASIYLARPRSGIDNLQRVADRLRAKLEVVDRAIDEAERNGQTATAEARLWKREAEAFVSIEFAAIQRDYQAMRCLGGCSWNFVCLNRRVTKKLKEVNELISLDLSRVAATLPTRPVLELPVSNNIVGMQSDVIQIVNQIRDENVRVIGIYGMGGVGKTTLLKVVNNHEEISKLKFEYVVWIVASKGCKLQKLQMDLARKFGLNLEDDESEDDRAYKLRNFLKEKNCLLFLDDIWQSYELFMLGMEPPKHGLKHKRKVVVLTTRFEHVCTGMSANVIKKVEGLSSDRAWELFLKYSREDVINSEPRINQLAKEIAKECAGVPLALITVSRAMSAKRSREAWNDALTQLKKSQMPEVTGMKDLDPMFAAFKLSYDSLEDDDMRARLLCCSLWPEDFEIDKIQLIQCWIGLGLIDNFDTINNAFDRGYSFIETLTSACLLELVDKEHMIGIKMHDVIRDMALWMASDCGSNQHKWIVKALVGLSQLELENEQPQVIERASFMHNDLSSLPRRPPTFSKLRMLMLQQNCKLHLIPGPFFQALPALTFLDLSGTDIIVLPREINMLFELQYLNLNFTPVVTLPIELNSLAKLKYLFLEGTERLINVPQGTISNLPLLKLLDLYESRYSNLDELEKLEGCRKYIGITLDSMVALDRLGSLEKLSIWKLQLQEMTDLAYPSQLFESIMSHHNMRQGLNQLEIVDVMIRGELTIARRNKDIKKGLECLRYMALIDVNNLQEITWKAIEPQTVFPNLHELKISGCKMLRNITWVLKLPNLSILRVSDCENMRELTSCVGSSGVGSSANFSIGLRIMSLAQLPQLNCISQQPLTFPYLERIYISSCRQLRKLPFGAEICQNKLKGISGETYWWEQIKWEDVKDKNALLPYFKPIRQKIVFSFNTKDPMSLDTKDLKKSDRVKSRALKIVTGYAGVHSAKLDADDRLTLVGADVDVESLIFQLRNTRCLVSLAASGIIDD